MQGQLQLFKESLELFARKYKRDIRKNPEFRQHFQVMCASIGVDPLACTNIFTKHLYKLLQEKKKKLIFSQTKQQTKGFGQNFLALVTSIQKLEFKLFRYLFNTSLIIKNYKIRLGGKKYHLLILI